MPRLCCGCCFSRRKRKSFPIHEKQREAEVTKVFIRHVETVRVAPSSPINKKTISKVTTQKKTMKEKNTVDSREPVSKLFRKSKQLETPSPLPQTIDDRHQETSKKPPVTAGSSPPSSTSSDSLKQKKNSKHRSYVESYDNSKETSTQKKNESSPRKPSNGNKSPAKSKLVLENVRKMIKDQNIQQQHVNHSQPKESVRL